MRSSSQTGWASELFHFVANLKPYLLYPGRGRRRFGSYLISPDYAGASRDLLAAAHRNGRVIAADNGNFDLIGELIQRFAAAASAVHRDRVDEEKVLGRYARPGDLSTPLVERYRRLARAVATAARSATPVARTRSIIATQQEIAGHYVVGMEDLTLATLVGLGIQPEYARLPPAWYETSSRRALDVAGRTRAGDFGDVAGLVFAGLHGVDFDTAVRAGRLAGEARVDGIACGLGGALGDPTYVDYRVQGGKQVELGAAVPRAYLRVVDVAAGLHLGYAEKAGSRPRFHALGIGTPILLPLLSVLGDEGTFTAVDSTAPILDAWSSLTISLYVDSPAPIKLKAHRVAEVWLGGGPAWTCACGACAAFSRAHPPRIAAARSWWKGEGRRTIGAGDLRPPSPLADLLPLLGSPSDPVLRREAGLARIAHNHWILQRLEGAARLHSTSPGRLNDWAAEIVDRYAASSADPSWKAAVTAAWKVAEAAALQLADADSGGEIAA